MGHTKICSFSGYDILKRSFTRETRFAKYDLQKINLLKISIRYFICH